MKIYEGHQVIIEQQGKIDNKKSNGTDNFQQIMEQVALKDEANKTLPVNVSTASPAQMMNGVMGVTPVSSQNTVSGGKGILVDSLKDTLNLIDFYAGKLADKSLPAENLSSLVDQLGERLQSMKGMASDKNVPEKLKPIISDLSVTLGAEIEKYRRGDYV